MRLLLLLRNLTPVAVEYPRILLAILAAILRATATSTFGKLTRELLPFAALIVRALPYATSIIVFAAKVPHDDPGPMLHIGRMVADGELLDKGKDIKIIWKQVFFLLILVNWTTFARRLFIKNL